MNVHNYAHAVSLAEQGIISAIEAYGMGSIRALAQEPVQNAIDAARSQKSKVNVEYRLLSRQTPKGVTCHVLTVTDSGTTGLQGTVLKPDELEARGYELEEDENWTAFEGNGFTKRRGDALGSRGQGKSAFFYHSEVPGPRRRMLMLYDTLLPNDDYRLGVRFVQPASLVRVPPLFGEDARNAIKQQIFETSEGVSVPLGLDPLREVGTRVIVPFLCQEAVRALRNGELERWLQRCWWRAIQTDKIEITVVDEENDDVRTVGVPEWWQDLPKKRSVEGRVEALRSDRHRMMRENEVIESSELVIKRLVLLHDEQLDGDEIIDDLPEFAGVQLLRGQQWIETRSAYGEIGDFIRQTSVRGFVALSSSTKTPRSYYARSSTLSTMALMAGVVDI